MALAYVALDEVFASTNQVITEEEYIRRVDAETKDYGCDFSSAMRALSASQVPEDAEGEMEVDEGELPLPKDLLREVTQFGGPQPWRADRWSSSLNVTAARNEVFYPAHSPGCGYGAADPAMFIFSPSHSSRICLEFMPEDLDLNQDQWAVASVPSKTEFNQAKMSRFNYRKTNIYPLTSRDFANQLGDHMWNIDKKMSKEQLPEKDLARSVIDPQTQQGWLLNSHVGRSDRVAVCVLSEYGTVVVKSYHRIPCETEGGPLRVMESTFRCRRGEQGGKDGLDGKLTTFGAPTAEGEAPKITANKQHEGLKTTAAISIHPRVRVSIGGKVAWPTTFSS